MIIELSRLLRHLAHNELSNLSLIDETEIAIRDNKVHGIIGHIDDALVRLHSRFILHEKEVLIRVQPGRTRYPLELRFARSAHNFTEIPNTNDFILDTPMAPFIEDVIKVLAVFNECGRQYSINDIEDPLSCFLPKPQTLQVPTECPDRILSVMYQARHVELNRHNRDRAALMAQKIDIPDFFLEAVRAFVAAQVYSNMNGQEAQLNYQKYMARFETICVEAEEQDLVNRSHHTTFTKLENRGFV